MHYKIKQRIKKEAHEEYQILSEEEKKYNKNVAVMTVNKDKKLAS